MRNFKAKTISLSVLLALGSTTALAQTATDVDCNKCVDTSDLAKKSVGSGKLKNSAVTTNKIANGAVTLEKIAEGVLDRAGGSSAQFQFVDGNDDPLGDVLLIEDQSNAWGYMDIFGNSTLIKVTVSGKKGTTSPREYRGDFVESTIYYEDASCSGLGYVESRVVDYFLLSLGSDDKTYFQYDIARENWTELLVDTSSTVSVSALSFTGRTDEICNPSSSYAFDGYSVLGLGASQPKPIEPVLIKLKP